MKRNLNSRKYCLDCSPFGLHNTRPLKEIDKNDYGECKSCGKKLNRHQKKYCNQKCHNDYLYKCYIQKWKKREVSGIKGKYGQISEYVRKYIFAKYNNKCSKCGWSRINPYTNRIPLEVDHINGDWRNSYEENLTLLCPNCHSLTKTYRGANRGNGRNITWVIKDK